MIKFFENFPEITASMSLKEDGDMRIDLRNVNNIKEITAVKNNRRKFFESQGIEEKNVVSPFLNHGNNIEVVNGSSRKYQLIADGLITLEKEICLSITAADCFPVLLYDPQKAILALLHAGWRGVAGGIVLKALEKMEELGSIVGNIYVAIGPGICTSHFEFEKNEARKNFFFYKKYLFETERKIHIDLKGIIIFQLESQKVKNIEIKDGCTFCDSKNYFSARRDRKNKNDPIKTMMVLAIMKNLRNLPV